jgi:hypothetical protein
VQALFQYGFLAAPEPADGAPPPLSRMDTAGFKFENADQVPWLEPPPFDGG